MIANWRYTGTYLEQSTPTKDQGRFTKYARFTSIHIANDSCNRNYLLQDPTWFPTLRMMLGVYRSGYGSLTRLYMDQWTQFKIVEQRLQIVWQLRKGSTITPIVLKWLADTIRDYHWQLSPDWTIELDHCEEREPLTPALINSMKHTPMSEYRCAHTMAYKEGF